MITKLLQNLAFKVGLGLTLAFALALTGLLLSKNAEIRHLSKQVAQRDKEIESLHRDNATLSANAMKLDAGLQQCNAGVEATTKVANAVAQAGVRAVQETQKAGKEVARKAAAIDSLPTATCEDAFKILKSK